MYVSDGLSSFYGARVMTGNPSFSFLFQLLWVFFFFLPRRDELSLMVEPIRIGQLGQSCKFSLFMQGNRPVAMATGHETLADTSRVGGGQKKCRVLSMGPLEDAHVDREYLT